jgi:hypothetical protein
MGSPSNCGLRSACLFVRRPPVAEGICFLKNKQRIEQHLDE